MYMVMLCLKYPCEIKGPYHRSIQNVDIGRCWNIYSVENGTAQNGGFDEVTNSEDCKYKLFKE